MGVREHIPLEQGLRLDVIVEVRNDSFVREHIPLEQGLRPRVNFAARSAFVKVREHIPLEQGLRRALRVPCQRLPTVREHIPLEQGLRLLLVSLLPLVVLLSESIFH